ncbi:TetR/AcrR family transcriptional regulator [Nocardia sp. NPDC060249]|uniref:TetR/AcrR family transcriptional regulator n=1 Tax=Nocardia sp. NPDC060249 TaxID=3347082 RepID=UPI00364B2418
MNTDRTAGGATPTARDKMLIAAALLFREKGVDATSFADVIERSHAPRGSIYHHFPGGKAQLAEEATRHAGTLMASMILDNLAASGPAETLSHIIDIFRRQLRDTDFVAGCPVAAGALESGDFAETRKVAGEVFASWESLISVALWQHGVEMARAQSLATTAVAAIEGAILVSKARRSTDPLDRVDTELMIWLSAVTSAPTTRESAAAPAVDGD